MMWRPHTFWCIERAFLKPSFCNSAGVASCLVLILDFALAKRQKEKKNTRAMKAVASTFQVYILKLLKS